MLISKTDCETRKAWALESKNSEESTIEDLLEFLEERSCAVEASDPKPTRVVKSSHTTKPVNIKSLAVVNASCPKCRGEHCLPQCPEFVSMPVSSRRSFARDQRLCYNCLGTKHSSMRCRVKVRCSFCNARHHSLVHVDCPYQSASSTSPPNVVNPTQNSAVSVVSNYMKNESCSSGLLPTAVVKVFEAIGKTHFARVTSQSIGNMMPTGNVRPEIIEFIKNMNSLSSTNKIRINE